MQMGGRGEVAVAMNALQLTLQPAYFLIENARLESYVSTSKQRQLKICNRERMAVSKSPK